MKKVMIIMTLLGVAACEPYTGKQSPCFGNSKPSPSDVVSMNVGVGFSLEPQLLEAKDCEFRALGTKS